MGSDIFNDLEQFSNLANNLSSFSNSIGTIILWLTIGTIVILPIIFYLKYKMEIAIVKKGTLQALNEFYNKKPDNNSVNLEKNINSIENINKEEVL